MPYLRRFQYPKSINAMQRAFDARGGSADAAVAKTVAAVIAAVEKDGDEAVARFTAKFDRRKLSPRDFKVSPAACRAAWKQLDPTVRRALEYARDGIEAFHQCQLRSGFVLKRGGARLEQRIRPIHRAGVYVPGGRAAYPSTMLMNVIPAQVAGVREIIVATPPVHGDPEKFVPFAAAHMLGVSSNIYQVGGAQAIAAMAIGTRTIPRVDKIVGPGNAFVAEAKRQLYGRIDIDSVAGESEVLIIADSTADPAYIAADLLAQAEHTGGETVVLVGIGKTFDIAAVEAELKRQLAAAPRRAQAESSLRKGGYFVGVPTESAAVQVANLKAPEHLEILTKNPEALADRIDHVGAIFLGPWTPEPIGDYVAGPNHVLPTGGTARFFSPLGVDDFLKMSNVLKFSKAAFDEAAPHTIALAESEGLFAHAESVRVRMARKPRR